MKRTFSIIGICLVLALVGCKGSEAVSTSKSESTTKSTSTTNTKTDAKPNLEPIKNTQTNPTTTIRQNK